MIRILLVGDVSKLIEAHLPILSLVCDLILAVMAFRASIAVPPGLYMDVDECFDEERMSLLC